MRQLLGLVLQDGLRYLVLGCHHVHDLLWLYFYVEVLQLLLEVLNLLLKEWHLIFHVLRVGLDLGEPLLQFLSIYIKLVDGGDQLLRLLHLDIGHVGHTYLFHLLEQVLIDQRVLLGLSVELIFHLVIHFPDALALMGV